MKRPKFQKAISQLLSSMRWLTLFTLAGLLFFSCEEEQPLIQEEIIMAEMAIDMRDGNTPCVTPILAGQHIDVGTVTVDDDGNALTVTYQMTDPEWFITETHLYVGAEEPNKPAPGRFPYKAEELYTQAYTYTIPFTDLGFSSGDCIYVAAHAVVKKVVGYNPPDYNELANVLPEKTTMILTHPGTGFGEPSYFDVTLTGGSIIDGIYDNWCVDADNTISPGVTYTANVYSSYEALPSGLIDKPENLDLVNWVINQGFAGQYSPDCGGTYTYGDVQRAIWELVENNPGTSGLGAWSPCRVGEIVSAALAGGEGFMPNCEEQIALILDPVGSQQVTIAQVTLASVQVVCTPIYTEETAWGYGPNQFKQGWGWWFECCLAE